MCFSAGPLGGYKYTAVVRKKEERERMTAPDCAGSRALFQAAGYNDGGAAMSSCGHELSSKEMVQAVASRHRQWFTPPLTPDGFWNMGFGDTAEEK